MTNEPQSPGPRREMTPEEKKAYRVLMAENLKKMVEGNDNITSMIILFGMSKDENSMVENLGFNMIGTADQAAQVLGGAGMKHPHLKSAIFGAAEHLFSTLPPDQKSKFKADIASLRKGKKS